MLKDIKGKITILFHSERGMTIEIQDAESGLHIMDINVPSSDNVVAVLSRLACVPCDCRILQTDNIGKTRINGNLEFEMPEHDYLNRKEIASIQADIECPEGWEVNKYFNSQDSFFTKDGKEYARCHMVKYVDPSSEEAKEAKEKRGY